MVRPIAVVCFAITVSAQLAYADAPRPLAPIAGARVGGTPRLRVAAPPGATVEVCADRACTARKGTLPVKDGIATPTGPLSPGRIYWRVHGGGPTWPLWIRRGAPSTSAVTGFNNDVDGDGHDDFSDGTGLFYGAVTPRAAAPLAEHPTGPVLVIPDINGDGYADVVATSPKSGQLYVHFGAPGGIKPEPSQTLASPVKSRTFGNAISGAGDVDGDGYGDLLVGAPGAFTVFLYRGGPTGLEATPAASWNRPSKHEPSSFGAVVNGVGDLDGDGYADFVAVAPGPNMLTAFRGGALPLSQTPTWNLFAGGDTQWSASACDVGDVDGDGLADLLHSFVLDEEGTQEARVTFGAASGLGKKELPLKLATESSWLFFARAGDIDGDGHDDVVVGELRGRNLTLFSRDGTAKASLALPQELMEARSPGDVDGDGYEDLVVLLGRAPRRPVVKIYRGGEAGLH